MTTKFEPKDNGVLDGCIEILSSLGLHGVGFPTPPRVSGTQTMTCGYEPGLVDFKLESFFLSVGLFDEQSGAAAF